jgi:hypothetical protein
MRRYEKKKKKKEKNSSMYQLSSSKLETFAVNDAWA